MCARTHTHTHTHTYIYIYLIGTNFCATNLHVFRISESLLMQNPHSRIVYDPPPQKKNFNKHF